MSIDVYYEPFAPGCRAVLMTAKHLNIPINLKLLNVYGGETLKPEFEKLNPQKMVPLIVDDGFVLGESRAIMQYLCNQYAPENDIYPKCPKKRAVVDRMLYFDIGSLVNSIWEWMGPQALEKKPANTEMEEKFVKQLTILNDHFLKNQKYVAGDHLTIADFTVSISIYLLYAINYDLSKFGNIQSWLRKLEKELSSWDEYVIKPTETLKQLFK